MKFSGKIIISDIDGTYTGSEAGIKRNNEAIEYFNTAIKHDKNNHEAYFYRGCAKYNNFLKQEAIEDYLKTTEINPDYAQAYFNLGLYYRSINDHDMACYYFRIAEEKGKANMEDYLRHCR